MTCSIRRETREDYAILTIDRLEQRNKVNEDALRELRDELHRADDEGVTLVVISGAGDVFCTGGGSDGYPQDFTVERHLAYARAFVDVLVDMGRMSVPLVARVNGDCLAGGTMLLNRCDLAVTVDSARFGLPELAFGGFPMLALATAIEQFPAKLVFDMAYLGRTIGAEEALGLNLVNRVCSPDDLDAEVDAIAAVIRERSRASIRYGRQAFYSLLRGQTDARLEQARSELVVSAASDEVRGAWGPRG
jgi:enoyl-CoA hydratase/carnithine racemase